ncbi:MAG: hypothetical protein ACOVR6_00025, partial [Fimbriimonas sp.]
ANSLVTSPKRKKKAAPVEANSLVTSPKRKKKAAPVEGNSLVTSPKRKRKAEPVEANSHVGDMTKASKKAKAQSYGDVETESDVDIIHTSATPVSESSERMFMKYAFGINEKDSVTEDAAAAITKDGLLLETAVAGENISVKTTGKKDSVLIETAVGGEDVSNEVLDSAVGSEDNTLEATGKNEIEITGKNDSGLIETAVGGENSSNEVLESAVGHEINTVEATNKNESEASGKKESVVFETAVGGENITKEGPDEYEKKNKPTDNTSKSNISSFIDLVDLSAHTCCGYCYVLRLVDPEARLGHVIILRSKSDESLCDGFSKLMSLSRFPPTTVYYDSKFSFISKVATLYPRVAFTMQSHSTLMEKERCLFLRQFRLWINAYGKNWLRGVTVVQAVTNTLSLE